MIYGTSLEVPKMVPWSSTRKCECPFLVRGLTSRANSSTDHSFSLVFNHRENNHPASRGPSAHPSHQQLAPLKL
ncbi:hypothetical protein VP01_3661g1 [Puccinia sorghi]|uniref:Uncharacterized protein n=1 Tax=Puccinia sorghi TaxID=27349 RepID=A0A0L6UUK3_9BASI|nr:hypothetical protein VP01_3661g1 [Puccinia sorghi]